MHHDSLPERTMRLSVLARYVAVEDAVVVFGNPARIAEHSHGRSSRRACSLLHPKVQ
jgi:hypothetical protein